MVTLRRENQSFQFCALAYRAQEAEGVSSLENVLIILVRDYEGESRVLARPHWTDVVDRDDKEYIDEMLSDFEARLRREPNNLLRQVSSLSAGPLITYAAGPRLVDHPELFALCAVFADDHHSRRLE
jgi:hypothetical protein